MGAKELFLPDFCHIRSVFAVVMMGQLLAFVLVLASPAAEPWQDLSLTSLFVQWIVLASAGLLCALRRPLAGSGNAAAAALSYLLILGVTAIVSELGYRLLHQAAPAALRHDFVLRSVLIAAIVAAVVLRYLYVVHDWKRRLEGEAAARIDALQARIRPHFLFNSLNTIASMIPAEPVRAEEAVEDLADLFRASLANNQRLLPLREELDLSRRYLRMEGLRLGERLRVDWRLDGLPEDALIPPLTLQPLLENAVYHGVEPHVEGGLIRIHGRLDGDTLRISLRNPLSRANSGYTRRPGIGMAQDNVRGRLSLAFGTRARLDIRDDGEDYQVDIALPYRSHADENPDR